MPRNGNDNYFNYPINVYPAGSYKYTTTAPTEQGNDSRATANPVEVPYAAGLGMAVNATTGVGVGAATLQQPADQQNYLTITGNHSLNDNTTIQVPTSSGALQNETITISGTRPQSV